MTITSGTAQRLTLAAGGLIGAIGVATAAASSHAESRNLGAISMIALAHGPALLALALAGRGRVLGVASALLGLGTVIFVADLGVREWLGHGLVPGAAPVGGALMIGGWLAVMFAAITWQVRGDR